MNLHRRYLHQLAFDLRRCLFILAVLICSPWATSLAQDQVHEAVPPVTAYSLEDCIQIGLERQPAVAAARASLDSAVAAERGVRNLFLAGLIARDLPTRRKQACLGITVAQAAVSQAEWETVYSVTRTYFTVVYAEKQRQLAKNVVDKLKTYEEKAKFLVKQGDPDSLVTQVDVDKLSVNIDLFNLKLIQATEGVARAKAALREAMGLEANCPLEVAATDLPPVEQVPGCDQLVSLAIARRPELAQAAIFAEIAKLEVDAQRAIIGPQANTFALAADIHSRPVPQGEHNGEYRPGAIGPEMPTTLVGHQPARVERAEALARRGGIVADKTRQLIELETINTFHLWQEAAAKVQRLANTPEKAASLLKTTKARFELGRVSGEDLIRAQTLDEQVQAEHNEALFAHALALAALERITAGGFIPSYRRLMVHHSTE